MSNVWESDGQSGYSITEVYVEHPVGTTVKLFLKKDAKDYADNTRLRSLIKKYSDHILVSIKMKEGDGQSEQVNSAQALWTRSPSEITTAEYEGFYKSTFFDFNEPFITVHNKSEGTLEFTNLLYVPKSAPFDLYDAERKSKISLYINRVFISSDLPGIVPTWLRFVKGVLDTSSLDLNVSREMVQNNPVLKKI